MFLAKAVGKVQTVLPILPAVIVAFRCIFMLLDTLTQRYAEALYSADVHVTSVWTFGISVASIAMHTFSSFTKLKTHRTISIILLIAFLVFHITMLSTVVTVFGVGSLYCRVILVVSLYQTLYCTYLIISVMRCSSSIACNLVRCAVQTSIRDYHLPMSIIYCLPAFILQSYNEYRSYQ